MMSVMVPLVRFSGEVEKDHRFHSYRQFDPIGELSGFLFTEFCNLEPYVVRETLSIAEDVVF
jgi:hypothetical protein